MNRSFTRLRTLFICWSHVTPPYPAPEYPPAPEDLGADGKWLWDTVAKELKDLKALSVLDLALEPQS